MGTFPANNIETLAELDAALSRAHACLHDAAGLAVVGMVDTATMPIADTITKVEAIRREVIEVGIERQAAQ